MSVIWFVIIFAITHLIMAMFAYRWGEEQGFAKGYELGKDDGFKEGLAQGKQIGLHDSVKEQMLNSLIKTPPIAGVEIGLQEQVRQELLNAINQPNQPPTPPQTETAWWDEWWDSFAGWLVLVVFVLLLALVFS